MNLEDFDVAEGHLLVKLTPPETERKLGNVFLPDGVTDESLVEAEVIRNHDPVKERVLIARWAGMSVLVPEDHTGRYRIIEMAEVFGGWGDVLAGVEEELEEEEVAEEEE